MALIASRHKLDEETMSRVQQKVAEVKDVVRRLTEGGESIMGEDAKED
jgi:hypothetical protein